MRKVPLGLAYLAPCLENKGIYVEAYNLNVDSIEKINFQKFDFVGITCLTPFIKEILRISEYIKRKNNETKIVVGGPHPTYRIREIFAELPQISYAIKGEGEISFSELVTNEENYRDIKGVFFKNDDGNIDGTEDEKIDLNELPYPNRRIFDHGNLEKRNPFRAILASRGCPFKCYNCQPILNEIQPFRLRKPYDVYKEVKFTQEKLGQCYFGFIDSEFPIKKSWLREFFSLIDKNHISFSFHCNARSDLLDEEILYLFEKHNITRLAIGIESGVQRVVNEVLHKNIDLNHTYEIFKIADSMGINTHGHFMCGIPGETLNDMHKTLEYAIQLPAASIEFNILTPWPGTTFWDICQKNGYVVENDCAEWNEKRRSYVSTPYFSNKVVDEFYQHVKRSLTELGWQNSKDGSVYYRNQPLD
jgi:magnesium-protoporphyrin IX monomethyl ester (oxidative) cyclase